MDDLEGEIPYEKVHKRALWYDILSADLDGEDSLLLNIRQNRVFGVTHNVGYLICGDCIGKVPKAFFNVVPEGILALVRNGNVALGYSRGIHRMMVVDHNRLLRRLGVEDAYGYFLAPFRPLLLQIRFHILKPDTQTGCRSP